MALFQATERRETIYLIYNFGFIKCLLFSQVEATVGAVLKEVSLYTINIIVYIYRT